MFGALRRRSLVVGAALLGFGGSVVASAPPAYAAFINNSCGPNYSLPPSSTRADVTHFYIGSTRVALRFAADYDIPAYIYWASVSSAPAGTRVWMDWSDNGGADWHRCGNGGSGWVTVASGSSGTSTRAVNFVSGRSFRACANLPGGANHCTAFTA